jgi:predicted dehydrogenase
MPLRGWLEITGNQGVIRVPEMWLPAPRATFEIHHDEKPVEIVTMNEADQIVQMIEDFGGAVLRKQPISPPAEEAFGTLRALDALARSARERRVVYVE